MEDRLRNASWGICSAVVGLLVLIAVFAVSATAATTQKKTLTVWDAAYVPGSPEFTAMQRIDRAFMRANPNVVVKHSGFPFAGYWPAKVQTAIATRRGPDVIATYLAGTTEQMLRGLVPLAGLLTPQQKKSLVLLPAEQAKDPSVHRLAPTTYAYYWVYNKQLFQKAGISSPPATWRQLLGACDALKAAGIQPIAAGFQDGYLGQWFSVYGFASQLFSPKDIAAWNQGKVGWDDPKMVAAWSSVSSLNKRGCFGPSPQGYTLADQNTQFLEGKAAMVYTCCGIGLADAIKRFGAANVGVFRMPRLPGSAYTSTPMDVGPNFYYGITRSSKNCGIAWKYLSFLVTPAAQKEFAKVGILPGVRGITTAGSNPLVKQIQGWLADPGNHTGPNAQSPQEFDAVLKLSAQLVGQQVGLEDVIDQLQSVRSSTFRPVKIPVANTPSCS
jgi:raffinose/stachyose/melibiose transport system substrate-binding protein